MALRAVAMGVRMPTGILSAYGTFLIRYTPSPARVMALMDPLLPLGMVASVLAGNRNSKPVGNPGFQDFWDLGGGADTNLSGQPVIWQNVLPKSA